MGLIEIIEKSLNLLISAGANCLPAPIPSEMATGQSQDDWNFWLPVASKVTKQELEALEAELGVVLSNQYKQLLQHKHFMELQISNVGFFSHPCMEWQASIKGEVFNGWPYELLLGRGFLPFATYSDWGLWCFATHEPNAEGEYPVYLWDHDRPKTFQFVSATLESALQAEVAKACT
jgi:hypothetical protein